MSKLRSQRLAMLFGGLAVIALIAGVYALTTQSDFVLLLVLVPLFGVLSLAFGISARD